MGGHSASSNLAINGIRNRRIRSGCTLTDGADIVGDPAPGAPVGEVRLVVHHEGFEGVWDMEGQE